jgi:hypothetical protein
VDNADGACPAACPHKTEGYCSEFPISAFQNFDATRVEWTKRCEPDAEQPVWFLAEGMCATRLRLLYLGSGLSVERRYFDTEGAQKAVETATDWRAPGCPRVWPDSVECGGATITKVVCGDAVRVGQNLPLP